MPHNLGPKANDYPVEIERLNVITALPGIILGAILIPVFILKAMSSDQDHALIGSGVFCLGFLVLFMASYLYHHTKDVRMKWVMKRLDHGAIFIMISGSYTPFILFYFFTETGIHLLISLWVTCIVGILFKLYTAGRFRYMSTLIYILMGAAIFFVSESFFPLLPFNVLLLLSIGGAAYLIGVIFYLRKSWKYHHPVWHMFVLTGALCHAAAVWFSL